jgi:NAD(P)-dependent dehydrogenase (short-subunit alcohol dehydrogenase family)
MRLRGRTALVTGSTKGLGLAIARAYAREGAQVVIHSRSPRDCETVAAEIQAGEGRAVAIAADLSRSNEVRRLAADATEALGGRVDILVNNAGQPRVAPSAELAEAEYRYTLDLNLNAYFILSQEIARGMLARREGCIINVSSINGTLAFPRRLAYCVSKAGVNMLTKVLAIEWADRGVRVNAIAPGYVKTEMVRGLVERKLVDEATLARRIPMGRLGVSEEIAEAAVYLASDGASYITGAVLTVDGGWMAYGYV